MICSYCNRGAPLVGGEAIYPHRPDLYSKNFYLCKPCNAYVGCHPGTDKPLGRLADAKLRKAKMAAHAVFDPLWKSQRMTRSQAYKMLAELLGLSKKETHIGIFDVDRCMKVVEVVKTL